MILIKNLTRGRSAFNTFGFSRLHSTKKVEDAVNNLLYNTPLINQNSSRRILSCLVTNEPGVLSRISGVLAGRGFNIDSLVASSTNIKDLSRMTIVLQGQDNVVDQAKKQLEDLVPVWAVLDYSEVSVIERELLLVRVEITSADLQKRDIKRQAIVELTRLFEGRVVDMTNNVMTIELCAKKRRIDAFLGLMKPYGIVEAVRSGLVALPRTPVEFSDDQDSNATDGDQQVVDATLLPPG